MLPPAEEVWNIPMSMSAIFPDLVCKACLGVLVSVSRYLISLLACRLFSQTCAGGGVEVSNVEVMSIW